MADAANVNKLYDINPKCLGEGASCKVNPAVRKSDGKKVAVKQMAKDKEVHGQMFKMEKDMLQGLEHPNIIQLVDHHENDKAYYIVTVALEGGELFDRIVDDNYDLTEVKVAVIVQQMLQALAYLHRRNIVHRDLKPENFLFQTKADNAKIVLIDFGTAKKVKDEEKYYDLVGTPYYLAPESATNQPSRTGKMLKASDIWAVGVIAYICLTGTPPFFGQTNREICRHIVKQKLHYPDSTSLSKGFQDFCTKCLAKRWKKRIDMDSALLHPWVIGEQAAKAKINMDTIRSLRQFNNASKLKKAVSGILAQNMGTDPTKRVREHFDRLDKDGNEELDLKELTQLMLDLGFHKQESEFEAQRILKEADNDGSNTISFIEFATVWQRKLLTVNEQYIRAVFGVLDSNGDGQIDKNELKGVLEGMTDKDIDEMMKEADTNGDGLIQFSEFKKAMKEQLGSKKVNYQAMGKARISKKDLVDHDSVAESMSKTVE